MFKMSLWLRLRLRKFAQNLKDTMLSLGSSRAKERNMKTTWTNYKKRAIWKKSRKVQPNLKANLLGWHFKQLRLIPYYLENVDLTFQAVTVEVALPPNSYAWNQDVIAEQSTVRNLAAKNALKTMGFAASRWMYKCLLLPSRRTSRDSLLFSDNMNTPRKLFKKRLGGTRSLC